MFREIFEQMGKMNGITRFKQKALMSKAFFFTGANVTPPVVKFRMLSAQEEQTDAVILFERPVKRNID